MGQSSRDQAHLKISINIFNVILQHSGHKLKIVEQLKGTYLSIIILFVANYLIIVVATLLVDRIIYLCCWRQVSVDIIDLFLETFVQHLVSFVKNQHLDWSGTKGPKIILFGWDHKGLAAYLGLMSSHLKINNKEYNKSLRTIYFALYYL